MTENCQKPAFSVANTGSSGTPVQTSRPCGRWVVGVFQGRLITSRAKNWLSARGARMITSSRLRISPFGGIPSTAHRAYFLLWFQ
ncbi:hypothetical protein VB152_19265 [Xanthomonas fragariae]|nr:hypothetical protein [Xanthomonas fragariae]